MKEGASSFAAASSVHVGVRCSSSLRRAGLGEGTQARSRGAARAAKDHDRRHPPRRGHCRHAARTRSQEVHGRWEARPDAVILSLIKEELAKPEAQRGRARRLPPHCRSGELVDRTLAERGQRLNSILLLDVPRKSWSAGCSPGRAGESVRRHGGAVKTPCRCTSAIRPRSSLTSRNAALCTACWNRRRERDRDRIQRIIGR